MMEPAPLSTLLIRAMAQADLDAVIEIAASLPEAPQWPRAAYASALDPGSPRRRVAMVVEAGMPTRVVGFVIAGVIPPEAELETIAVAKPAQRRGIARRLFAALSDRLQAAHVTEVTLEVRASNLSAQNLYQTLGFAESGRRGSYYVDPVEDAIVMRLSLPAVAP